MSYDKIVAVVPCYNEGRFIGDVVSKTAKFVDVVVVIDNMSKDNTFEIAKAQGAFTLKCPTKGMGASVAVGLVNVDADIYVTLDGDGQHDPADIPALVQAVRDGADIAIGKRDFKEAIFYRMLGNRIIAWALNVGARCKFEDAQCGMRAFSKKMAYIGFKENGFGYITETIIKSRRYGFKIVEVPVKCIYHPTLAENSTMNPIKQGLYVLYKTLRWRFWEILGV